MISQEFKDGVSSRVPSDSVKCLVLVANVGATFAVPEGAGFVVINSEKGGVFVKFGGASMAAPAVPSASGDCDGGLDPVCVDLTGVVEIGAVSKTAQIVTFEFYRNP